MRTTSDNKRSVRPHCPTRLRWGPLPARPCEAPSARLQKHRRHSHPSRRLVLRVAPRDARHGARLAAHVQLGQSTSEYCDHILFTFMNQRRKIYQLNAHTMCVLRPSDSDVKERRQTVLDPDAAFKKGGNSETAVLVSAVQLGKRRARE